MVRKDHYWVIDEWLCDGCGQPNHHIRLRVAVAVREVAENHIQKEGV